MRAYKHPHAAKIAPPLAASLGRIPAGMAFPVRLGVTDEPGWVTAGDLVGDAGLLEDLMSRAAREFGVDDRTYAGTSLLRGCLWRLLCPIAAVLLAERRMPDPGARNVALRFGGGGFAEDLAFAGSRLFVLPEDPEADHPDAEMVGSEEEMLGRMRETLSGEYLADLVPALRGLGVRRGTRALRRVAADVCADAFMSVGRDLGREAEGIRLAERLLSGSSPLSAPLNHRVLAYPGGSEATRVRNACCLYYKTGNGTCFTCPRKTDEERIRELAGRSQG